jgi:hypothetical protein
MIDEGLPIAPVYRGAPETSVEAAESVNVSRQTKDVWMALRANPQGLTDMQVASITGHARARTRRKTLVDQGRAWWTGRWKVQANGRRARVWTVYEDDGVREDKPLKMCPHCDGSL